MVHPVLLCYAETVCTQAGVYAHSDPGQPEGSHGIRVLLPRRHFSCKETDSMYCVHAHQRTLFLSLKKWLFFFKFVCQVRKQNVILYFPLIYNYSDVPDGPWKLTTSLPIEPQ